jgi:1-acyl-sn-glycerol-3-phosphate acyltransferase
MLISFIMKLLCKLLCFFAGMRTTKRQVEFDYTTFLGPNYKETTRKPKYLSTYVSNHASWLDVPILISNLRPAFASSKTFKNVPIFGILV